MFTAHVNVNDGDGAGFVNAPAGTQISFTIDSRPGLVHHAEPVHHGRAARAAARSRSISATTGTTVVSAHVTTTVGGI